MGSALFFNDTPMGAPVTGGLNLLLGFWAIGFDYPVARKLLGGQRGVHWTHIFDHMMCLLVVLRVRVGCAHSCAEWLLGFRNMETIGSYVYLISQSFACLVAISTSTSWLRDAQVVSMFPILGFHDVPLSVASWSGVSGICLRSGIASQFIIGPS